MGQYDIYENHQRPCNREDSPFACGEISSRLCVTCLREAGLLIPTRFGCAGADHEVASVDDRWPGVDHEYVKVGTPSGDTYILRYDIPEHVWQITLFREAVRREDRPTGRAPSSRALRWRSARL